MKSDFSNESFVRRLREFPKITNFNLLFVFEVLFENPLFPSSMVKKT